MEISIAVIDRLATTNCIPIASLESAEAPATNSSIKAVVSLIWPYSTSTRSVAILLAEPDFRKRNNKGQVRIQLNGPAAQALMTSRVEIGDFIHLSLQGARWVNGAATIKTPGRSVDGELLFKHYLQLLVQRNNTTVSTVEVDQRASPRADNQINQQQALLFSSPVQATPVGQLVQTPPKPNHSKLWDTPTPFRKDFGSDDPSSDNVFDLFGDVDAFDERPAKRFRFGRTSGKWRYVGSKSVSPEKNAVPSSPPAISSPLVMGPPRLPPIQTEFHQFSDALNQSQSSEVPRSPELRPVQSAVLPAISPFPLSPQHHNYGMFDRQNLFPRRDRPRELSGENLDESTSSPRFDAVMDTSIANTVAEPSSPADDTLEIEDQSNVQMTRDKSRESPTSTPAFPLSSPPLPRSPPPAPSPLLVPSPTKPAPVIDLLSDEEEVPVPGSAEPFSPAFQIAHTFDQSEHDQSEQGDEHHEKHMTPFPSFDGAADEPASASTTEISNIPHESIARFTTLDDTLISSSNLGRATTQESGQLTPELSQRASQAAPLASFGHRVDDILDGRMPPTPQRSDIPPEMVGPPQVQGSPQDEAATLDKQEPPASLTAKSSAVRWSDIPDVISPWFHSQHQRVSEPASKDLPASTESKEQAFGQRTTLTYFSPLSSLNHHLNNSSQSSDKLVDVLAVVTSPTAEPKRAKGGPKDFSTVLHVADQSMFPKTIQVQLLRRSARFLPIAAIGDVVLLRNFTVKSRDGEAYLQSETSSAWCVWQYAVQAEQLEPDIPSWARQAQKNSRGIDEECRGASVEIGPEERGKAHELHVWWTALQAGAADHSNELLQAQPVGGAGKEAREQNDRDVLVAS